MFNPLTFFWMVMSMQTTAAFWTMKVAFDPRALWLVSQRYPDNVIQFNQKRRAH